MNSKQNSKNEESILTQSSSSSSSSAINSFTQLAGGPSGGTRIQQPLGVQLIDELLEPARVSDSNAAADDEGVGGALDEDEEFGSAEVAPDPLSEAYAWEAGYERSWNVLKETDGRLDFLKSILEEQNKKKVGSKDQVQGLPVRKGIIR